MVLAAACVTSWLVVVAAHGHGLPGSGALIAAALVLLAVAAMWARDVAMHSGSLRDSDDVARR